MAGEKIPRRVCVGDRFGRLTVVGLAPTMDINGRWRAVCRCECGTIKDVAETHLKSGATRACGCQRHRPAHNRTHNMRRTDEYRAWMGMRTRCLNPNFPGWISWGGRGITVCERWDRFENFFEDMGPRPSPKHSIERRDNDGPYDPSNCYWATPLEQARNTRKSRVIEYDGRKQVMSAWAAEKGLSPNLLWLRLKQGWAIERALNEPVRRVRRREAKP